MSLERHSYYDADFTDFLEQLLQGGRLDGAAEGITKKVVAEGIDSLSTKQRFVFDKHVINQFVRETCSSCSHTIPWSEMYAAYDNGGLCNWCEHMQSKDD